MQNKVANVGMEGLPWHGSLIAWRLLNALAPSLLLQPVVSTPGGLQLLSSRLLVAVDAEASGILKNPPQANTILFRGGGYGLHADLWLFEATESLHMVGAMPWVDPVDSTLWLFRGRAAAPFVHVTPDGFQSFARLSFDDMLAFEQGFESVRLRLATQQEAF